MAHYFSMNPVCNLIVLPNVMVMCRILDKAQMAGTPDEKLALQRLHRRLNSVHEELQIYNSLLQRFKDAPRYSQCFFQQPTNVYNIPDSMR